MTMPMIHAGEMRASAARRLAPLPRPGLIGVWSRSEGCSWRELYSSTSSLPSSPR